MIPTVSLSKIPVSDQLVAGGVVNHLTSRRCWVPCKGKSDLKGVETNSLPKGDTATTHKSEEETFKSHLTHKNHEAADFSCLR